MGYGIRNILLSLNGRAVVNCTFDMNEIVKAMIEKGIPEDEAVNAVNVLNKAFGDE
jgi:hypothetical protein